MVSDRYEELKMLIVILVLSHTWRNTKRSRHLLDCIRLQRYSNMFLEKTYSQRIRMTNSLLICIKVNKLRTCIEGNSLFIWFALHGPFSRSRANLNDIFLPKAQNMMHLTQKKITPQRKARILTASHYLGKQDHPNILGF